MKTFYIAAFMITASWASAQENKGNDNQKSKNLEEVVIKKKTVQKKSDRLIYNVSSSPIAKGSNGFDLVKQTPMVTSTDDATLKILGKNSVIIYINGKKQNMETEAVIEMLKNMPAENIAKIEVITVPSSEYQMEGNEAVINLILKNKTTDGINGNAKLENIQSKKNSTKASVSLNFRKGKWGIQGNLNGSKMIKIKDYTLVNGNLLDPNPFTLTSTGEVVNYETMMGGYLNINYDINDHHKLDFSYQQRSKWDDPAYTEFYNELKDTKLGVIKERTQTKNDSYGRNNNQAVNLGYDWKINDEGSSISAGISYLNFDKTEENTNTTLLLDYAKQPLGIQKKFYQSTPLNIDNFGAKVDFTKKWKDNNTFTFGSSYNHTKTDSDALVSNLIPQTGKDENQSNHFVYVEKIGGLYSSWDKKWNDKLTSKLGLRVEKTVAEGNVLDKNSPISRNEINWLPYFNINYSKDENNQISYSFSNRVKRPSFSSLNPAKIYVTANNYIQNNPFSESEIYYNNEIQYSYKSKYFLTFSYNYIDRASDQIPLSGVKNDGSGEKVLAHIRTNYGSKQEMSLSLATQQELFKGIWIANHTLILGHNQYRGSVENDPYDHQNLVTFQRKELNGNSTYLQAQINNTIRLSAKKDWYLGVNYYYTSALQLEVGKLDSFQNLNLSMKKMYHQWTFSLEVQDVFNTSKINIKDQDDYGNIFTVYQNQYNQKLLLGLTYNFGNQKLKKMMKSENANEEIKSRTNN